MSRAEALPPVLAGLVFALSAAYFIAAMCATLLHFSPLYTPAFTNTAYQLVNGSGSAQLATFSYTDSFAVYDSHNATYFTYTAQYPSSLSMSSCAYTVYTRVDSLEPGYMGWQAGSGATERLHAPHCALLTLYRACLIGLATLWLPLNFCTMFITVMSASTATASLSSAQQPPAAVDQTCRAAQEGVVVPDPTSPSSIRVDEHRAFLRRTLSSLGFPIHTTTAAPPPESARKQQRQFSMVGWWRASTVLAVATMLLGALSVAALWGFVSSAGLPGDHQTAPAMPIVLTAIQCVTLLIIGANLTVTHRNVKLRLAEKAQAEGESGRQRNLWCCL